MSHAIGENIRRLRREKHMTQGDVAKALGISVQAVSKWENGGTPDIYLLPAIAGLFAVSIDKLFQFSSKEDSLHKRVMEYISRLPDKSRQAAAMDLAWAAFKGASRLPNLQDRCYTESVTDDPAASCTRCFFIFDEGFGYASGDVSCPSIFLLSEPKQGFGELLVEREKYEALFSALAKPQVLEVLRFIAERPALPFSCERLVQTLGLKTPEKRKLAEEALEDLIRLGYLTEEKVDLDSGVTTIYRPNVDVPLCGLFYFASETLRRTRLWYFSNELRNAPFLREKSMQARHS